MPTQIKFGTSGWRAIVADEFTFENVRRAVTGIARHVSGLKPTGARLVVGRDPRFLGETFVDMAADILEQHGIQPLIVTDAAPTPAISWEVMRARTDGAINFTASHNPPEYNGIKFSTPDGAPALPEVTHEIERLIKDGGPAKSENAGAGSGSISKADLKPEYLAELARKVDFEVIRRAQKKFVYDPLYGAARGYLDTVLRDHAIPVTTIHDRQDVMFGGHAPEPADENIAELQTAVLEGGAA